MGPAAAVRLNLCLDGDIIDVEAVGIADKDQAGW